MCGVAFGGRLDCEKTGGTSAVLSYPASAVGRLRPAEICDARRTARVRTRSSTFPQRQRHRVARTSVTDGERLVGVAPLRKVAIADPDQSIESIMKREVTRCRKKNELGDAAEISRHTICRSPGTRGGSYRCVASTISWMRPPRLYGGTGFLKPRRRGRKVAAQRPLLSASAFSGGSQSPQLEVDPLRRRDRHRHRIETFRTSWRRWSRVVHYSPFYRTGGTRDRRRCPRDPRARDRRGEHAGPRSGSLLRNCRGLARAALGASRSAGRCVGRRTRPRTCVGITLWWFAKWEKGRRLDPHRSRSGRHRSTVVWPVITKWSTLGVFIPSAWPGVIAQRRVTACCRLRQSLVPRACRSCSITRDDG